MITAQKQKVVEKEAETERKKAVIGESPPQPTSTLSCSIPSTKGVSILVPGLFLVFPIPLYMEEEMNQGTKLGSDFF